MRTVIIAALVLSGCKDQKRPPPAAPPPPIERTTIKPTPPPAPKLSLPDPKGPLPEPQALKANGPSPRPWKVPPGPEVCADCHPDEVDGYAKTGMGRSFYRPDKAERIEDFDPQKATVVHPVTKVVYRALIDEAGRWWQSESVPGTDYEKRVEVLYIIGSGNATRSYIGQFENELVELPLTWYVGKRLWDMSPGYEGKGHARFERRIQAPCLFCHNDLSPLRDETMAGYHEPIAEGISCTRCHGDASAHVKARMAGEGPPPGAADATILNPARLPPAKQLQVCQQCHLAGKMRVLAQGQRWDEYDVRTPLPDYMSIYVDADDTGPQFGIASHGHRLSLSRCFQESEGQLVCTKCHNPHQLDPTRSQHDACVGCHQPTDCGDEHGKTEGKDCARCHMPHEGTNDIPHVTFTDHFIRRRPEKQGAAPGVPPMEIRLVDALAPDDDSPQAKLRLGMAHAELARAGNDVRHARAGLPLLAEYLERMPQHVDGWWQFAQTLHAVREYPAALDAFLRVEAARPDGVLHRLDLANTLDAMGRYTDSERVLKAAVIARPDYREAWGNLANSYQRQGRLDEAEALYAKIEAVFPGLVVIANNRGYNAIQRGRFDEARTWFEAALARDATNPMGYFNLGTLALKQGDKAGAEAHFRRALKRDPEFALGHWLIGRMALHDGRLPAARDALEAAARGAPDNPVIHLDLAQASYLQGDVAHARDTIWRGLLTSPQQPVLTEALSRINAGQPPQPMAALAVPAAPAAPPEAPREAPPGSPPPSAPPGAPTPP